MVWRVGLPLRGLNSTVIAAVVWSKSCCQAESAAVDRSASTRSSGALRVCSAWSVRRSRKCRSLASAGEAVSAAASPCPSACHSNSKNLVRLANSTAARSAAPRRSWLSGELLSAYQRRPQYAEAARLRLTSCPSSPIRVASLAPSRALVPLLELFGIGHHLDHFSLRQLRVRVEGAEIPADALGLGQWLLADGFRFGCHALLPGNAIDPTRS